MDYRHPLLIAGVARTSPNVFEALGSIDYEPFGASIMVLAALEPHRVVPRFSGVDPSYCLAPSPNDVAHRLDGFGQPPKRPIRTPNAPSGMVCGRRLVEGRCRAVLTRCYALYGVCATVRSVFVAATSNARKTRGRSE